MSKALSPNFQDIQEQGAAPVTAPTETATPSATSSKPQNHKVSTKQHTDLKKVKLAKNSFVLSKSDSVKLNIVQVEPTTLGYFDNNILTRTLQPVAEMADELLVVKVDSTNSFVPKNQVATILVDPTPQPLADSTSSQTVVDSTYKALADTIVKDLSSRIDYDIMSNTLSRTILNPIDWEEIKTKIKSL